MKCTRSDSSKTFWQGYRCQGSAAGKCLKSNSRNARRQGYRCQASAAVKCLIPGSNPCRNNHAGNATIFKCTTYLPYRHPLDGGGDSHCHHGSVIPGNHHPLPVFGQGYSKVRFGLRPERNQQSGHKGYGYDCSLVHKNLLVFSHLILYKKQVGFYTETSGFFQKMNAIIP